MQKISLLLAVLLATFSFAFAQTPVLGTYPATTVAASGNIVASPSAQPTSATSISVAANTSFKGVLLVNPTTGVVSITNAYPAGDYIITVKALNGAQSTSRNFLLHVNNTPCSQGYFGSRTGSITTSGPFSIAAGDFNGDGRQDIATTNYYYGTVSICLNNNTDSFAGPLPVVVGGIPTAVAVGDFNNDGRLDFATSINDSSRVAIRLGNGVGGFTVAPNVSTDIRPAEIAIGDFNNDGNIDLAVVSNYYPGNVAIRLGNGAGGFTGNTNLTVGSYPTYVATGDFNDDGRTDLAVSNSNTNNVTILSGSGTGNFVTTSTVSVGSYPSSVVVADFNGDGEQDFATANNSSGNISIRLGNGTGTFTAANDINSAGYAIFLASGDWNGDGFTDLACADFTGNRVFIYLGTGTGSFNTNDYPNSSYGFTSNPRCLVTGDFNGDGRQDYIVGGSSLISIRRGLANDIVLRGNNTDIAINSTTPTLQNNTDFGNVNSSRIRSFTIRNTSIVSLIINNISIGGADSAAFTKGGVINLPALVLPGDSLTFRIAFAPDAPGVKNTVVTIRSNHCTKSVYSFAIQATGTAITPQLGTYPMATIASAGGSAIVTPVNTPTNAETLTAYTTPNFRGQLQVNPVTGLVTITNAQPAGVYTITVKANGLATASNSFTLIVGNTLCSQGNTAAADLTAFGGRPYTIISSDFNSDGKPDIAYVASNSLSVRLSNGAGGFGVAKYMFTPIDYGIVSADFNGDGNPDIAGVSSNTNSVIIYSGLGDTIGSFIRTTDINLGVTPRAIVTADFNGDGIADLATANVNSNTVSIRLGNRAGFFSALPNIAVGRLPAAISVADFNNDGKADLAVGNSGGDSVTVVLGDGNGGFIRAPKVIVQASPNSIAVADLNGDGNQDLLVANLSSNTISIRMGNGAGGFIDTTNLPSGLTPYTLQTGDFNGDGKIDFICSNYSGNTVVIYFGNGSGNFTPFTALSGISIAYPGALVVSDFNGDGRQDFIVTNGGNSANLLVRLGGADEIDLLSNNIAIANGDTIPSLANNTQYGNVSSNLVKSFTIRNSGTTPLLVSAINISGADSTSFIRGDITLPYTVAAGSAKNFTINFSPLSVGVKRGTVTILNDDCDKANYTFAIEGRGVAVTPALGDYADTTTVSNSTLLSILPTASPTNTSLLTAYTSPGFKGVLQVNPATGVVTVTNAYPAGVYTIFVKAHGIVSATKSFVLTVSNPVCSQGLFASTATLTTSAYPKAVAVADFDGDGKQDFICANYLYNNMNVGLGTGTGSFRLLADLAIGNYPYAVAIADFNSDGRPDIAVANRTDNTVAIRIGDGAGGFTGTTNLATGTTPQSLATGDFNSDGKTDIAVSNYNSNNASVWFGDGAGSFTGPTTITAGINPSFIAVNDFNNDGKTDLIIANYTANTLSVRLGDGAGNFTNAADVSVSSSPTAVATGDFNSDGKTDIAIANGVNVSIRLGDGSGSFTGSTNMNVNGIPSAIVVGDFNGDGKADFAAPLGYNAAAVAIRLGDGTGNFSTTTGVSVGNEASGIAIADFNSDGRQDLVVANSSTGSISIRLNNDREINVQGNSTNIPTGSITPSIANHTAFNNTATGSSSIRYYMIQNTGTANLTVTGIKLSGADSTAFTIGGITLPLIISGRSGVTFSVTLSPTDGGIKETRVNIASNDCDEGVYTFAIRGKAVCTNLSANNIWLGFTANWNAPSNWSLGAVPNGCGRAVVNAGVPFMPQISTNASCYSLTLNNGATFTVTGTGNLTITGP